MFFFVLCAGATELFSPYKKWRDDGETDRLLYPRFMHACGVHVHAYFCGAHFINLFELYSQMKFTATALLLALATTLFSQGERATLPLTLQPRPLKGGCPSQDEISDIHDEVRSVHQDTVKPIRRQDLNGTNSSDSTHSCSNGTGGWTRVAYLNMTDPVHQCPSAWTEIPSPFRTCGRRTDAGCDSVIFSTNGIQYSNVLGRVVAYQFGSLDGFVDGTSQTIDSNYLDGVSITHGMPRNHIRSFTSEHTDNVLCPCGSTFTTPSFVGEDYFCESGNAGPGWTYVFYPDDPLWDGQGCGSSTCCTYNDPPWFCKQLPQATTDDIEVRICAGGGGITTEDTPTALIEVYTQ